MGRFSGSFSEADAAFDGKYKNELTKLKGLSKEEIDSVIPGTEKSTIYSRLVKVVEKASKENLSKAELTKNIKALGDLAVTIAKKVPELAAIL